MGRLGRKSRRILVDRILADDVNAVPVTSRQYALSATRTPRSLVPLAGMLVAVGVAVWAFVYGDQPIFGDAEGYFDLGRAIATGGLGAFNSDVRTWGYPALIALVMFVVGRDQQTVHTTMFVLQVAMLFGVAWVAARRIEEALGRPGIGDLIFVATAANPFLLMHAVQLLTDLPAAVVLYLAVALSLPQQRGESPGRVLLLSVGALFCAGFGVMLRPSNLAAVPIIFGIWAARAVFLRPVPLAVWPVAALAFVLPFLPQAWINQRAHGIPHPLIVRNLYGEQSLWGIQHAKYATIVIPGVPVYGMFYANPFRPPADMTVREMLLQRPLDYLATQAVHAFALIDQDYPFTYIRELDSWYRWPLSVFNYLLYLGALAGIVIGVRQTALPAPGMWRGQLFAVLAPAIVAGVMVGIYLPTAVESRFSLPLYLLLATPFVLAATSLWALARTGPAARLVLPICGMVAWVGVSAAGSVWIQSNATMLPLIREAMVTPPAAPEQPSAAYDADLPKELVAGEPTMVDLVVTNTGQQPWKARSFYPVRVSAQFAALKTDLHEKVKESTRGGQAAEVPVDVAPGESATVRVRIVAPPEPGRYSLTVRMVRTGAPESATEAERIVRVVKESGTR